MTISPISHHAVIAPMVPNGASRAIDRTAPAPEASLRGSLSNEEREFFEQAQRIGPVSYGRGGAASAPVEAPLGQLLDLKA